MRKMFSIILALSMVLSLVVIPHLSVSAAPLYEYIDAESASLEADNDLVDNGQTYWGIEQGNYLAPAITSEQKRAGSYSMRYQVAASSVTDPDRMEHVIEYPNPDYYPGLNHNIWQTEAALGLSVYLPSDFTTPTGWFVFYQIKQHDGGINPSPNISLGFEGGNLIADLRHGHGAGQDPGTIRQVINLGSISNFKGKWTDFVINFKLTNASNGFVKIYTKPSTTSTYSQVVNYTGQTGYTACVQNYILIEGGIYRKGMNFASTLYLDEIRYGTGVEDVKFPGSTLPGTPTPTPTPTPGDDYSVTFEAESASGQSLFSPFTVASDAGASGGQCITTTLNSTASAPATGIASYTFNLSSAAAITTVTARLFAADSGADSFWYKMDSGSWTGWYMTTIGSWTEQSKTFANLAAGNHTLYIAYRDGRTKIDKFTIVAE